jgi:hypothetical protein
MYIYELPVDCTKVKVTIILFSLLLDFPWDSEDESDEASEEDIEVEAEIDETGEGQSHVSHTTLRVALTAIIVFGALFIFFKSEYVTLLSGSSRKP